MLAGSVGGWCWQAVLFVAGVGGRCWWPVLTDSVGGRWWLPVLVAGVSRQCCWWLPVLAGSGGVRCWHIFWQLQSACQHFCIIESIGT